jgi:hypothetical protein
MLSRSQHGHNLSIIAHSAPRRPLAVPAHARGAGFGDTGRSGAHQDRIVGTHRSAPAPLDAYPATHRAAPAVSRRYPATTSRETQSGMSGWNLLRR